MKKMIYGFAAMMVLLAVQVVVDVAQAAKYGSYSRPSYSRPSYSRPSYTPRSVPSVRPRTNFTNSRAARPAPAKAAPVKPMNPVAKPLQQKKPLTSQRTPEKALHTRETVRTNTVESSPSWWQMILPVWIYSAFTGESNKPAPGETCSDAERKLDKCKPPAK